jgi:chaperone modulatory protein CbpM
MKAKEYISIPELCSIHNIEISFISNLNELGLVEVITVEKTNCIHQDTIADVEKMIRLHQDLEVNPAGIDVIFNLLQKVEHLHEELNTIKNRLKIYDSDF